ncbi:MAG: hypothetical protein ACTHYV_08915 [Psychroflexus sp.]
MKRFIKSILYFIPILGIAVVALICITTFIDYKNADFSFKSHPKYIITGHSQPESAYNDTIISDFKNISFTAESYFYNFIKIKKVLEDNNSIEVVFIEFTNNQINKEKDQWIWGKDYMLRGFEKYASFMSFDEKLMLIKKNPVNFINALSLSENNKITRILSHNHNYEKALGGFRYLKRYELDSLIKVTPDVKYLSTEEIEVSEKNLSYLDDMIEFCQAKNKRVIFVRSPIHEKYPELKNDEKFLEILNTRYASIEFLDFLEFPLSTSERGDFHHINHKGAKVYSEWFANLLKDGLLDKENKQEFINNRIKRFK